MRRTDQSQLVFAFADSPKGGGRTGVSDVTEVKAWLLLIADSKAEAESVARTDETAHLLEDAARPGNLARALLNVARNKGAAGVDGRSVQEVIGQARTLLPRLRKALISGDYEPGDIRRVWIPKPGGKGQRGLGIPNVIDRWVQQAVLQVLEPVFEPRFHASSHGFRPRRGAHTAIAEAKTYVRDGYDWVVDMDLSKFFDRVNHQRLLNRMAQRVEDGRILKLVHRMLKAKVVMPDGTKVSTDKGTPQGGPLSPLLSNVVLDELDRELARRGLRFVRYADDCNIFVRSERSGHRVMDSIRRFIEGRLRLKVNEDKSAVDRPGNRHFLGFSLLKNKNGHVAVDLSERTRNRIAQRIRELTPRNWGSSVSACIDGVNRYLQGWYGYFRICTKRGARRCATFDAHIRRRIRAIIVRQKGRRARYLYRHLVKRGASSGTAAKAAWSRKGAWFISATYAMHTAYDNAWFAERVVTLWHRWHEDRRDDTRVCGQQLTLFG